MLTFKNKINVFRKKSVGLVVLALITIFIVYSTYNLEFENVIDQFELLMNTNWRSDPGGFNFQSSQLNKHYTNTDIRKQLNRAFPYKPREPIPKIIWQTWKIGQESPNFPAKYKDLKFIWHDLNPDYSHRIITDYEVKRFVETEFRTIPKVIEAFNLMKKPILKVDFFRYLVIYAKGGTYADLDIVALRGIDNWISSSSKIYGVNNNPGLVIGIEADPDYEGWEEHYARRLQFTQWTFQGKAGHPILREIIINIVEITIQRSQKNQMDEILDGHANSDVMNWTGPGIWTDTIFAYFNNLFNINNLNSEDGNIKNDYIDFKTFTGIEQPIVLDDVVVLPRLCFSPGIESWDNGGITKELVYVYHLFEGNWKNEKINE